MDWKRKLTSRKFWMAFAGFVSMLAVSLGMAEEQATQITSLIMAGATVLAYIIGEGLIDKETAGSNVTVTVDKTGQTTDDAS